MRKKILVRAPVLTRSGYGEHSRFVLRALRTREDLFDIYVLPINWGQTGWLSTNDEERRWLDERIKQTTSYGKGGGKFDISIQVSIPNEFQRIAPINIGVTAGIETTMVSSAWIEKSNEMDKIITISEHSKNTFIETIYKGVHEQTQQEITLACTSPVEIVHYPAKVFKNLPNLEIDLEYDFNYLTVAQAGPRKNLANTIRWFIEENIDQPVGLVVKTFIKNNAISDRENTENMVRAAASKYPNRKCKIYLLHGDMTDEEMHSLYSHPKIKCLVSLSHGEGFGLPLFEAAYSGLPIVAPGWSGQCDFLYAPYLGSSKKNNKTKKQPYFAEVEFNMGPIPEPAVWDGVLERDSMWCYPTEGSYKMKIRQIRKNYKKWDKKAKQLQKWIHDEFAKDKIYKRLIDNIYKEESLSIENWLENLGETSAAENGEPIEFE